MSEARRYTIVLADDVAALRRLVRLATEKSGRFQVVGEAGTGIEAIAKAGELKPDLVLLDLSMPELDGLEALPRVLEASPKSHVVVLSGFNHVRMEPVAKRLGASAYLEKGLEPDALVAALLHVLEPGGGAEAPGGSSPGSFAISPIVPLDSTPHVARGPPQQEAKPAARSFRVLVVEADAQRAQRLIRLMSGAQVAAFAADHCSSLAQAMPRVEARGRDLVLIDPHGLGCSPEEAFIDVLAQAAGTPVVALAAAQDVDLVARAMRLGIEDCLDPEVADPEMLGRSLLYAVERRRAQEARRQVRDQQAEIDRLHEMEALKTRFFNAAAHELGTPLTPIRLQLAILRRLSAPGMEPAEQRSLDILERNVERMSKLNQDILDVARLQAGRLTLDKHPFQVKDLVRDLIDTFEPLARDNRIGLTATCTDGIVVDADQRRLMQVLFNLTSNALKFTPPGGVVAVDVRAGADDCQVQVRDTGPGLRPEQIAKLFQPFSQVLGEEQPPGVGTGLGLYVSRGIVELHGGHIECRSPGPGKGATFSFSIPRVQAQPAAHADPYFVAAA